MANIFDDDRRRGGRPAAGTDPQKRQQIIDGAGKIFSSLGFDATSMSDVARQADVSKATLYVYFPNKEQLFASVCAEKRDRNIAELIQLLDRDRPLEQVLTEFGSETLRRLSQPFVIAAHRIVIGVAERMPEIGQEFFAAGPQRIGKELAAFLGHHVGQGRLKIDDTYLAAVQFVELCQATIFRSRLYAAVNEPASEREISAVVGSAVRMFLAAYRAP
jgi:TetR/AcrR family transcriptional regulator of autoinduction and epiphytic fitness